MEAKCAPLAALLGETDVSVSFEDDLSWSGEIDLASRRRRMQPQDIEDGEAWDLELDEEQYALVSPSDTWRPTQDPLASPTKEGCQDQDEHSRWLRATNALLQEAMVYLVGSIALQTEKDERAALQCFRRAHELGHARGTFRVGLAHLEGTGGAEQREELARTYLREAVDQFVSHQVEDVHYYGSFQQYLENDFRHGALHHAVVLEVLRLYAGKCEAIKKVVDFALARNAPQRRMSPP